MPAQTRSALISVPLRMSLAHHLRPRQHLAQQIQGIVQQALPRMMARRPVLIHRLVREVTLESGL
jgi:hypothetical protein